VASLSDLRAGSGRDLLSVCAQEQGGRHTKVAGVLQFTLETRKAGVAVGVSMSAADW